MTPIGTCCVEGCPPTGCCGCESYPENYSVAVSGVANSSCTMCSVINTTHTIAKQEGDCQWRTPAGGNFMTICTTAPLVEQVAVVFDCVDPSGGTNHALAFRNVNNDVDYAKYTAASSTWSCLGTNVLTLISTGVQCTGWPTVVTLIPA